MPLPGLPEFENATDMEAYLSQLVKQFKDAMMEMVSSYKQVGEFVKAERDAFEFRDTITAQADMVAKSIGDALQKAISSVLLDPNTYQVGMIGSTLGSAVGGAIGFAMGSATFTPFGAAVGTVAGAKVGGSIGAFAQNIIEGPTITGAQTAQLQYATHKINTQWDRSGWDYLKANENLARELNMTKGEVTAAADALSKVGYGFFEKGGQDAIRFARSMDMWLNLPAGTTLGRIGQSIKDYGEGVEATRTTYNALISTGSKLYDISRVTNDTILRSLSSYANLADALAQVDAQARNTGASMEGVNTTFLKLLTMAADPKLGGPISRPGATYQGVGTLTTGLGPAGDYRGGTDVVQAGAMLRTVLEGTEAGRGLLEEAKSRAMKEGWGKDDIAMRTGAYLAPELWSMLADDKNGMTNRLQYAMLSGLGPYAQSHSKSQLLAYTFAMQMLGQPSSMMAYQAALRAVSSGQFTGTKAGEAAFMAQPDNAVTAEYHRYLAQAEAAQSAQTRLEKRLAHLTQIFGPDWWAQYKHSVKEVFGLSSNPRGFEHQVVGTGEPVPTRGDVLWDTASNQVRTALHGVADRWASGKSLLVEEQHVTTDGKAVQEQYKELKRHEGYTER